jgi:cell division protein ZapA (FtsZ GTPase activity inhibitor)
MTYPHPMTDKGQGVEVEILGCAVKIRPDDSDRDVAQQIVELVKMEVAQLKHARPSLRDTDVAVLVALKMATDKLKLENEFKTTVLKVEKSLESAASRLSRV